jgi:pimeloyl-ACP methyl ester carboxylesterase
MTRESAGSFIGPLCWLTVIPIVAFGLNVFAQEAEFGLFERPGRMVKLSDGNRRSLYCIGEGRPTVFMETGFGGGAFYAWYKLQPLLGRRTRTCSYDRAGYGFSELGDRFPRDREQFIRDLRELILASGESGPYVLVGHSNGGAIVAHYASRYPDQVVGLVFLDAIVPLPSDNEVPVDEAQQLDERLEGHLDHIRRCLARAERGDPFQPPDQGECLGGDALTDLSDSMKDAYLSWLSQPEYWKSYLSEAECNYGAADCTPERPMRADTYSSLSVRVAIASVASLGNDASAPLYGLSPEDTEAIAAARASRANWEAMQARVCEFAEDCRVDRLQTANHYVQNADPDRIVALIAELF